MLPEDFSYQQLARLTPGYVGADLMSLCREAAMAAVNRVLLEARPSPQSLPQSFAEEPSGITEHTEPGKYEQQVEGKLWFFYQRCSLSSWRSFIKT